MEIFFLKNNVGGRVVMSPYNRLSDPLPSKSVGIGRINITQQFYLFKGKFFVYLK